jgi:hypothetical protein
MRTLMGCYYAYYDWIVCLMRLKFGTEMGFDPDKTLIMFGKDAPSPRGRGGQRMAGEVHFSMLPHAP